MHANVIDTLHFANGLKAAGFAAEQAEGLAQALNDELAPQMITPTILRDELRPIGEHLGRLDAHIVRLDAKIAGVGARLDAKIDSVESKLDAKIDSVESKLDARVDGVESKLDALDSKIESTHRELSGKLNVLATTMALGFTALIALGLYNAASSASHPQPQADAPEQETAGPPR